MTVIDISAVGALPAGCTVLGMTKMPELECIVVATDRGVWLYQYGRGEWLYIGDTPPSVTGSALPAPVDDGTGQANRVGSTP